MINDNDTPVLRKVLGKKSAAIAVSAIMATSMSQPLVANAVTLHHNKKKRDSDETMIDINHITPEWSVHKVDKSIVQVSQAMPIAQSSNSVTFRVDFKLKDIKPKDISFKVSSVNKDTLFNDSLDTEVINYNTKNSGQALIKVKVNHPNNTLIKNDIKLNVRTSEGKNVVVPINSRSYKFKSLTSEVQTKNPVGLTFKQYTSPTTLNMLNGPTFFNVPFRFISNIGKTLPVYNVYATCNPEVSYAKGFEPTSSEASQEQISAMEQSVKNSFTLSLVNTNLGSISSSSTGLLNFSMQVKNYDNHMIIKPNVTIHYSVNGKSYSKHLPMNTVNLERVYTESIEPVQTFNSSDINTSSNSLYVTNNSSASFSLGNNSFYNQNTGNPLQWKQSKIKSLNLKITGLSNKFSFIMKSYPGASYNKETQVITLTGKALEEYLNNSLPSLFTVNRTLGPNSVFCSFNITPEVPKYLTDTLYNSNSLVCSTADISINFLASVGSFMDNQVITLGSITDKSIAQPVNFKSEVGEKIEGNTFNLNSFLFIANGFAIPYNDKDVVFYSVDNSQFSNPQSTCEAITSGKLPKGIVKYTYEELQNYIKTNKKFPNINVVEKATTNPSNMNAVQGEVGVLPSYGGGGTVSLNMYTVGTKVKHNLTPSEFKEAFDSEDLPNDVITSNGFFLSSNDNGDGSQGKLVGPTITTSDVNVSSTSNQDVRYGNEAVGSGTLTFAGLFKQETSISALNNYKDTVKPVTVTTVVNSPRKLSEDNSIVFNLTGIQFNGGSLTVDYNKDKTKVLDLSKYLVSGNAGTYSIPLSAIGADVTSISQLVAKVSPEYISPKPENVTAYLGVGSSFNSFNSNIIQDDSSPEGACSTPINVYSNIDGAEYNLTNGFSYSTQVVNATTSINNNFLNNCYQNILQGNNKDKFNLQNVVRNSGNFPTSYYTIEHFPLNSSDTLPGSYNDIGNGPGTFTPEGFSNYSGSIYLIPSSESSSYNNLMNTQDTTNMSTLENLIKTDKSLVKYEPGMDISKGYVGFIHSTGTVNPGNTAKLTMNIKATGLSPNTVTSTYTGFKYYDTLNQIGSVSNIKKIDVNWAVKGINKIINVSVVNGDTGKRLGIGNVNINSPNGEEHFSLDKCTNNIATVQARTKFDFSQSLASHTVIVTPFTKDLTNSLYIPSGVKYEIQEKPVITNTVNSDGVAVENVVYKAYKYVQVVGYQAYYADSLTNNTGIPVLTGNWTKLADKLCPVAGNQGYQIGDNTATSKELTTTYLTPKQQVFNLKTEWAKVNSEVNFGLKSPASYSTKNYVAYNSSPNTVSENSTANYNIDKNNVSFKVGDQPTTMAIGYDFQNATLYAKAVNIVNGSLVSIGVQGGYGGDVSSPDTTTSTDGFKIISSATIGDFGGNTNQEVPFVNVGLDSNYNNLAMNGYKVVKATTENKPDGYMNKCYVTIYVKKDAVKSRLHVVTEGMKYNPKVTYVVTYKDGSVQTIKTSDINTELQNKDISSVKVIGLPLGYSLVSNKVTTTTKDVDGCTLTDNTDNVVLKYNAKAISNIVQSTTVGLPLPGVTYDVTYTNGDSDTVVSQPNNTVNVKNIPIQSVSVSKIPDDYKLVNHSLKTSYEDRDNVPYTVSLGKFEFAPKDELSANLTQTTVSGKEVSGVKYTVHYSDGSVQTVVSKDNGTVPLDNNKIATSVEINNVPSGWRVVDSSVTQGDKGNNNVSKVYVKLQDMKYVDIINNKMESNKGSLPSNIKYLVTFENGKTETISASDSTQVISNSPVKSVKLIDSSVTSEGYTVVSSKEDSSVNQADWVTTNTTTSVFHKLNDNVNFKAIDQSGNIVKGVEVNIDNNTYKELINNLTNAMGTKSIGLVKGIQPKLVETSVPAGYKINGPLIVTTTTDSNGDITYKVIQKLDKLAPAKVTTEVMTNDGRTMLVPSKSYSGYNTQGMTYSIPQIPKGYHLVNVTLDGKDYKVITDKDGNGVITGTTSTQNLVWNVVANNTVYVSIITTLDGHSIPGVKDIQKNIKTGTELNSSDFIKIPEGYRFVRVDYNNRLISNPTTWETNATTDFANGCPAPNFIHEYVEKIENTVTYKAIDQDGKIVKNVESNVLDSNGNIITKDLTNAQGIDKISTNVVNRVNTVASSIPAGYKADGGVVLTKTVSKNGDIHWEAVQKLTKLSPANLTTEVVDTQGKVLVPLNIVNGYESDAINYSIPKIPKGYHLVKTTDNGKDFTPSGSVIGTKDTQNLVWVVEQNDSPLKVSYTLNGKQFGKITTSTVKTGSDLDVTPNIPKGYRESGITYNGSPTTNADVKVIQAVVTGNNVVINLTKINNTITYKAIDQDDTVVKGVSSDVLDNSKTLDKDLTNGDGVVSISDNIVTGVSTNVSSVPQGYKLNGDVELTKTVSENGDIHWVAIQKLDKLAKADVTTEVITTSGKVLVPTTTVTGYAGNEINYNIPKIPKGYEIVRVTDNGNDYTPNGSLLHPNTGSILGNSNTQKIVWVVQNKETTVTVTYKDGNKIIGSPKTESIKTGSPLNKVGITVPKGYREVNINVNGVIDKDGVVEGNAISTPNTIIVNLAKLHETVNISSICDGELVSGTKVATNEGSVVTTNKVVSGTYAYNSYRDLSEVVAPEGYKVSGKTSIVESTDKEGNQIVNIVVPLTKLARTSITTEVVTSDGKILVPSKTVGGYVGSKDSAVVPNIPKGYEIVSITNNKMDCKGLPNTFTNSNQDIIWTVQKANSSVTVKVIDKTTGDEIGQPITSSIKTGQDLSSVILPNINLNKYKIVGYNVNGKSENSVSGNALSTPNTIIITVVNKPTVTTEIVTSNGKVLVPVKTSVVDEGSNLTKLIPGIPNGYHFDKVIVNGKSYNSLKDIPITVTQNDTIRIVVSQNTYTDKVTVKTKDGTILVPTKVITGTAGTSTGLTSSSLIPKGYNVVSVTDNNNISSITDSAITYIQNRNSDVVITVAKDIERVTTVVETPSGSVIVPSKETTVPYGGTIQNLIPGCPEGYTPVKIVVNNKDYRDSKDIPNTVTSNTNVVVVVKKIIKSTISTSVITTDGKVLVPLESYSGIVGDSDNAKVPVIPKGYKLVKITNNGKVVNGLPSDFTKDNQDVVWIVEKVVENANVNVVVKTLSGEIIVPSTSKVVKVGSAINSSYIPNIPKGYKIVSVTTDGKYTGVTPNGVVSDGTNSVVIIVKKVVVNEPLTVVVKTSNGTVIVPAKTESVKQGFNLTGKLIPAIPKDYTIKSISVNGVVCTHGLSGKVDSPTDVVVIVSKVPTGSINVIVKDINGNIIVPSKTASGLDGSKDSLTTPNIPKGYEIVSITNNGNTVKGMPDDFTGVTQNVVYTVKKIDTKVTTEIVTTGGVILQPSKTISVKTGTAISSEIPNTPSGYKTVSITVNNKEYTSRTDISGDTSGEPVDIIVTVSKPVPVVTSGIINVTMVTNTGRVLVPSKKYIGNIGEEDTASIPTIPAGYKLVDVTNNGKVVSGLPNTFEKGTQNVVYVVEKIEDTKITTVVKTVDGEILVPSSTIEGKQGTVTGLSLVIPNGYHLVSITNNGKTVDNLPKYFGKTNENIVELVKNDAAKVVNHTGSGTTNTGGTTSKSTTNSVGAGKGIQPSKGSTNPSRVANDINNIIKSVTGNNDKVSTNPKTGDSSNAPFEVGLIGGLLALVGLNIKKKKSIKDNK